MSNPKLLSSTLRAAFRASLPVMTGYLVLGMAFGILLEAKGYSWFWALFMSTIIYAGSMQVVAVDLLSGGASLLSAALITLLVNARLLIYGLSMLTRYQNKGREKPYLIFALTDETYALLCRPAPEGLNSRQYDLGVSLLNQLYWVTGSVAGSLLGSALPFDTTGIDFAMTALFVVIFTEQFGERRNRLPGLIGLSVTAACLWIFGPLNFLIPAMILIVTLLSLSGYKNFLEKGRWQND